MPNTSVTLAAHEDLDADLPEVVGFANNTPPPARLVDNFNAADLWYIATTTNPFGKKNDGSKWYLGG